MRGRCGTCGIAGVYLSYPFLLVSAKRLESAQRASRKLPPFVIQCYTALPQWLKGLFRYGGGAPQVDEVTCLGGRNPPVHIISHFNLITFT